MNKKYFLLLLIITVLTVTAKSQNQPLNGYWEFIPEKSSHIDLFGNLDLEIRAEGKDIQIIRIWGKGSRIHRDTFLLKDNGRKQTSLVTSRVFPTNVFMGMKVAENQKRVCRVEWNPEVWAGIITESFPGMVSQGDKEFEQEHYFRLEPKKNILTYEIRRPSRKDMPIKYLFKKKGECDAYLMNFDSNWTVKEDLGIKAACISLQGIVNREKPNLYFVYPDTWDFRFTPEVMDFLKDKHYYKFKELKTLDQLIDTFKDNIQGYIVWDPEVRTSLIVSFTLAGLKDAIVISPDEIPVMEKYGMSLIEDFRGDFNGMSDFEIYSWARDEYWDQCSKDYIVWMGGDAGARMRPGVADWGIRQKAFFNDLSTKVEDVEEYKLADELLSEMNEMGMVFGWHSYAKDKERDHVRLTSSHGLRVEGLHTLPNMSFMTHIEASPGFEFKNNHSIDPDKAYIPEKKVYISCVQTDCLGLGAWTRPGRGAIPYAWEVTMNWIWLAPAMMEYFYSAATPNDYFIGSLSGPGYMYPKAIPKEKLKPILTEAVRLMKILDLNVFELMDYSEGATVEGNTELPKDIVDAYREYMPDVLGFINGYAPAFTFGGTKETPFFSYDYYLSPDRPENEAVADLKELAAWNSERPYYCLIHVRQWSDITRVEKILNKLGSDFKLIPLDEMMMYIKTENTFTGRYLDR